MITLQIEQPIFDNLNPKKVVTNTVNIQITKLVGN